MSEAVSAIHNQTSKKSVKIDEESIGAKMSTPGVITRERSFVRISNNNPHQNANKRRSLVFSQSQPMTVHQQVRAKPAMEIYRPPNVRVDNSLHNKLNVHAQEFTMHRQPDHMSNNRGYSIYPAQPGVLQHSKSGGNMHQLSLAAATARQQALHMANMGLLMTHPLPMGIQLQTNQIPVLNTNVLQNQQRVKFAQDVQMRQQMINQNSNNGVVINGNNNPLQRSKSLSAADALANGVEAIGIPLCSDASDIGEFSEETKAMIEQAKVDPNQLSARSLMELADQIMRRSVEGRRYALPISRLCIAIIAKEKKETFLEAILNTCRQWYQERDKVLGSAQTIKSSSRPRFTAFMSFLTEMFCQLKRRQLQLRTHCDGIPPSLVLLTVLAKCCEDCVKPPIRSLSEIECLFYVLTCIGRDMETHLPQNLEALLSSVRDAFLNSSASAPAIRRTLLQLIELQASRWQLPGNTVLYYYPSNK